MFDFYGLNILYEDFFQIKKVKRYFDIGQLIFHRLGTELMYYL